MRIREPIHGNIELNEFEARVIDTPQMQRLRYIKQLDVTYLIFPGAHHTRFEHSLGTMAVTKVLTSNIYKASMDEFSYVGLLHDIGHGPFSHLSDLFMKKYLHKTHEQIGEEIIRNSEIKDIISESGLSFDKIISYFRDGNSIDIVSGALGADRIDYLMRDSHYTGVAYGVIDYERLKTRLALSKGKVAITDIGISGAESLLIARYFMFRNVYTHHTKIIAHKMLHIAVDLAIENGDFDANQFIKMYDDKLIEILLASKNKDVTNLVTRFQNRKLFKRAYYMPIKSDVNIDALESEISNAGFDRTDFIAHQVHLHGETEDVDVVDSSGNLMGRLPEISPIINALNGVIANSKMLLVACDKKNTEKINSVVKKFVQ